MWRTNFFQSPIPSQNSQHTKELRYFIENGACLFDPNDKYPIWDENHREELEKKIIEHYYMREIGFETFGAFKFHLNVRMREIMPYYIDIYKTTQYEYNPIENYNMTEGSEETSKTKGSSKGSGVEKFSDTPMGKVENLDTHLTNATTSESNADSSSDNENKHTAWRKGNIGVMSTQTLITQEREITLNLDVEIIEKLSDLFLGVY